MSVGVNLEWKLENVVGKLGSGWVIVNGVDEVCMGWMGLCCENWGSV